MTSIEASGANDTLLPPQRATQRRRSAPRFVATALLGVCMTTMSLLALGAMTGQWRLVPVRTGSMQPGIPAGAAVIATPFPLAELKKSDVIIFHAPNDDRRILVHRVIEIGGTAQAPAVRTKGDANAAPDPWKATLTGTQAWRPRFVVPKLGLLILLGRAGLIKAVLIALAVVGLAISFASPILQRRTASSNPRESSRTRLA